jgi:drug/metabolite transporter (DMT)-like permease
LGLSALAEVHASAWWALAYVGVVSSWLGFLAWYAALARDPLRVSQVQLLQPLVGMGLAGLLLGEAVSPWAVPVGLAVALCMWAGQRSMRR